VNRRCRSGARPDPSTRLVCRPSLRLFQRSSKVRVTPDGLCGTKLLLMKRTGNRLHPVNGKTPQPCRAA
jgi:hypothetical protein